MRIVGQNYTITLVQTGFNPALSTEEPPTPPPTPERFSLTFYVNTANTPDALNSDGNFYDLQFPYDFVQWVNGPVGSDGGSDLTVENDPFADYRKTSNDTHTYTAWNWQDVFNTTSPIWHKRLPPISANLDVTIIVDEGVKIGSNTIFLSSYPTPSFAIYTGDLKAYPEANQAFTQDASANLTVEIRNSGNVHGGGGLGGRGRIQSDGKQNFSGGGGGGGGGLHQNQSSGTYPGKGGDGAQAADGSAGKGDDSGSAQRPAGGAGGAGSVGGTPTRIAHGGGTGGAAFAIINTNWYDAGDRNYGPTVSVVNKSTGFIQSGGGGGGGGGYNPGTGTGASGGTGGAGGDLATAGSAGSANDPGAAGIAGLANSMNFGILNPINGGRLTIDNENPTAGSVKDRTGSY